MARRRDGEDSDWAQGIHHDGCCSMEHVFKTLIFTSIILASSSSLAMVGI